MATFLFSNVNCNSRAAHPQLSNMKDCQNRSNDTLPNEPTAYDNNMYLTLNMVADLLMHLTQLKIVLWHLIA